MWGGLPDVFLKSEFQDDRSINVKAVGVEICLFQLTRFIAYTTACCYRTSRDNEVVLAEMGLSLSCVWSKNSAWAIDGMIGRAGGCMNDPTGDPPNRCIRRPNSLASHAFRPSITHSMDRMVETICSFACRALTCFTMHPALYRSHTTNNNNNNINDTNTNANIYSAVIMARPLWEFTRFIRWMQTQRQVAANPQTNRLGLWVHL